MSRDEPPGRRFEPRPPVADPGATFDPPPADALGPPRATVLASRRLVALPAPPRAGRGEPGPDWSTATVPGCWTMQGFDDRPQYTNVQMPFPGRPPDVPADNPTGLYERTVEVPSSWAGRRIVLHVGAAESVLIVRRQRGRCRPQQGLPPRRRVRRQLRRPPGAEHDHPPRHQMVGRDVHRGPGPVVAWRDHPLGLPVRDGAGLPRRRPGDRRSRRRPPDRHARPEGRRRLRGDPAPGWRSRHRSATGPASSCGPRHRPACSSGSGPGRKRTSCSVTSSAATQRLPTTSTAGPSCGHAFSHRPGLVGWRVDSRTSGPGRPRSRPCIRLRAAPRPDGRVVEEAVQGSASGGSRSADSTCSSTGGAC